MDELKEVLAQASPDELRQVRDAVDAQLTANAGLEGEEEYLLHTPTWNFGKEEEKK